MKLQINKAKFDRIKGRKIAPSHWLGAVKPLSGITRRTEQRINKDV
jgi:hypothetical protein